MTSNMVRVNDTDYQKLRQHSLHFQFELNRQISMGAIVTALLEISDKRPNELAQIMSARFGNESEGSK